MPNPIVTALIPNYKTLKVTKLCLRLLRKYTDPEKIRIIVIDNDSQDNSLEYLKSLKYITLIERKKQQDDTPSLSHARALDLALAQVTTPYVLSMHTDTFVKNAKWLDILMAEIEKKTDIAGVGSWKLENKPFIKRLAKAVEYQWESFYYRLIGKTDHALEGKGKNYLYLRSHLALYRMDLIRKNNLSFSDGKETAGKIMHKKLLDNGYKMIFLESAFLSKHVIHLNHATMVLHPKLGARKNTIRKGLERINKALKEIKAEEILGDDSLDN
ncbi:MAG: glycosyltransferase family 2 protein [Desulfobacterales bacterium]|nr:glycosyltransferase family 2 protein [Desulfobacterales bacterium]